MNNTYNVIQAIPNWYQSMLKTATFTVHVDKSSVSKRYSLNGFIRVSGSSAEVPAGRDDNLESPYPSQHREIVRSAAPGTKDLLPGRVFRW